MMMDLVRACVVLGVAPGSSRRQVVAAFKAAALAHHPDKNTAHDRDEATARFRDAKSAYDVLIADLDKARDHANASTAAAARSSSTPSSSVPPPAASPRRWQGPMMGPAPPPPSTKVRESAFASFRPERQQSSSAHPSHKQPPAPSTRPSGHRGGVGASTSSYAPSRGGSSKSGTRSTGSQRHEATASSSSSSSSSSQGWRGDLHRWGQPCGGCAECRRAASVPTETRKKHAKLEQFRDVAVVSARLARHKPSRGRR
jgi:curved DNA-binding protein CbpA